MVKMYNEFYDLDVVKKTKDLVDLPHDIIVKNFNILYGNDISNLAEGSVVMVTDVKLKTLGFFRKNKDEDKIIVKKGKANWDVVFMDVTSHTGLDFDVQEYFKEDEDFDSRAIDRFENEGGKEDVEDDKVSHPSHYTYGDKFEVIEIVEEISKQYPSELSFAIGNAIKYIARAEHKNGKQDIEKSVWYLNRVLEKWDDAHGG